MAKKYQNKVPRKQKKKVKKKAGLQGQSVPKTEVVNLANKNVENQRRREAQSRRYNENKRLLESAGLSTDIISKRTSQKETRKIVEAEKRKQRQEALYGRKISTLINAGFSEEEARKIVGSKSRPLSNKKIEEFILKSKPENDTLRLSGRTYLYVGVAEMVNGFKVGGLSHLDTDSLKELTIMRLEQAAAMPDDSGSFAAVFKFSHGSKSDMEHRAKVMYKRGYNMNPEHLKLDGSQYQKLTVSNKWSKREFFEMFYTCISQMKNSDVLSFNDHLKRYCQANNFPFMDDIPFSKNM